MKNLNIKKIKLILIQSTLILSVILFGVESLSAQATGMIRGRVLDSSSGDPMIGVTVVVMNAPGVFGITDIDGRYVIGNAPVGPQTVRFSMMGYQTATTKVNVTAGGSARANVALGFKTAKTVVVRAKKISNTQASMLSKRKKAAAAQDAISAEQISKSPDSDAAEAVKRVTGVTIIGGKFVYIRGLGERYTGVQFNGSTIPSPEPEKRVVPLDIFPTSIIDNLVTVKTYTANLPGSFGGGLLEINSKDYPEKTKIEIKLGTGYHTLTTFQSFRTYSGGNYDWFGFDDGTRAMPDAIKSSGNLNDLTQAQVKELQQSFNNKWAVNQEDASLPSSFTVSYGSSFELSKTSTLGIIASALHKRSFKNRTIEEYHYSVQGTLLDMSQKRESIYSTTKGGLLSLTYKINDSNKVKYTTMFNHITEDETSNIRGYTSDDFYYDGNSIIYQENAIFFNQLAGNHFMKDFFESTFKWLAAYSTAKRDVPDQRGYYYGKSVSTPKSKDAGFEEPAGDALKLSTGNASLTRNFEAHDEYLWDIQPSIEIPFKQWNGLKSKFELGSGYTYRERGSDNRRFFYSVSNLNPALLTEGIGVISQYQDPASGLELKELTTITDNYNADQTIVAPFAQVDLKITGSLRSVLGVRYEKSETNVISKDIYTKQEVISTEKKEDVLPSINLIYALNNKSNIRVSGSQTVSRPDFKEKSDFEFTANFGQYRIKGNPELEQSNILNGDIRYEFFPSASEVLAISGFYKSIKKPIEVVRLATGSGEPLESYQNGKMAIVGGGEFEIRKGLGFIHNFAEPFAVFGNVAYIYSDVSLYADNDNTNKDRTLQGQSPYVINFGLDYEIKATKTQLTALYYVFGRRIAQVGNNGQEDIYDEPVHTVDFALKQRLYENGKLKFTVANILDPEIIQTRDDEVVKTYKKGVSFGMSYEHIF